MKILFVFKNTEWLGVELLSACLKQAGHEIALAFEVGIDGTFYFPARKSTHKSILAKIREFQPHLIAFSSTTTLYPWVREVASAAKHHFDIPIMVGGIHATICAEKVITDKNIDMICIGEGEEAMVELANKWQAGQNYYDTRNIWFKAKDGLIKNDIRPPVSDLDKLPFPDKDLFYEYGCFTDRVYIMTGRGCPYQCTYCHNHQVHKLYNGYPSQFIRRRSVDSIIEELRYYSRKYHMKSVHFFDDMFIIDKKWIMEFCQQYSKEIGLPFYCLVRADHVTREIMEALKEAGSKWISMGLESGNEYILNRVLKRDMDTATIIKAADIIKKAGIKLITFNMFGLPSETREQMLDTVKLNLQIKPDALFSFTFYPFPGTELMKTAYEQKYIDEDTLEKIQTGIGNYTSESILKHPYKMVAYNIKVILPLLNKMPRWMHNYFLRKWIFAKHPNYLLLLIKIVSIPCYSPWEAKARVKEQINIYRLSFGRSIGECINRVRQYFVSRRSQENAS